MNGSGLLAGFAHKLTSVGTAAKAAVATLTVATTATLAGGAAGVLPAPAQHVVATAVGSVTPFEFPDANPTAVIDHTASALPVAPVTSIVPAPSASASAGATTPAGSAGVSTGTNTNTGVTTPSLPAVTTPTLPHVSLPSLPGVGGALPGVGGIGLPTCVASLIPAPGTAPDPTKLVSQIPACIQQVLASLNLPTDVSKCIASVLGSIGGIAGASPTSMPSLSSLNLGSCVPVDATSCASSVMSWFSKLPTMGGGSIPGMGMIPGIGSLTSGSIPTIGSVSGCVPLDVAKCLSSLVGGTSALPSTGTTALPKLDLSACMPTAGTGTGTATGSLPSFGAFSFFSRR